MHYLTHGASFAIVEDDAQAAKHVAAGWTLTTLDAVRALWRARDAQAHAELRGVAAPTGGMVEVRVAGGVLMYRQGKKAE